MTANRDFKLTILILIFLVAGCSPTGQESPTSATRATIEGYLDRLAAFGFSGQVLTTSGDELIVAGSFGYADRSSGRRLHMDEPMAIASLSKQFTAAAVLSLVDDGLLVLDDSLGSKFGNVPSDKRGITIHQLLTHTSGLPRNAIRRQEVHSRDSIVDLILALELRQHPGLNYGYSNAGYQMLAALVEILSGQSFDDYCRTRLFQRAGLINTRDIHHAPSTVIAYNEWTDVGSWSDWPTGWKHRGSGGQVSTANDLRLWWQALRSGQVLSDSLIERMFTPHALKDENVHYGYGWEIRTPPEGDTLILHGGDNEGFHSEMRWNAATNDLVIVLTHMNLYDESGWWLGLHKRVMASNLLRLLGGDSLSVPPEVSPVPENQHRRYEGTYMLDDSSRFSVWSAGDVLWVGALGQSAVNLLLPPDTAQVSLRLKLSQRTTALLDWIPRSDQAQPSDAPISPGEVKFFAEGMREEWTHWHDTHGPLTAACIAGSVPLPWDDNLTRTQAQLIFGSDTVDYHFTWNDDALYETISEIGRPFPLILPVAKINETSLATFDHVTQHSVVIETEFDETGRASSIIINGFTAWR